GLAVFSGPNQLVSGLVESAGGCLDQAVVVPDDSSHRLAAVGASLRPKRKEVSFYLVFELNQPGRQAIRALGQQDVVARHLEARVATVDPALSKPAHDRGVFPGQVAPILELPAGLRGSGRSDQKRQRDQTVFHTAD